MLKLNKNTPILLTGTIKPNEEAIHKVRNIKLRKRQYIDSISWWAKKQATVKKVVFCENSDADFPEGEELKKIFAGQGMELEILRQPATIEKFKGKGWAESLLINFALGNSQLLAKSNNFFKITGRYIPSNFEEIFHAIEEYQRENQAVFMGHSVGFLNGKRSIASDFFWSEIDFYRQNLLSLYKNIDDEAGDYLEHELYQSLSKIADKFAVAILQNWVIFVGVRGANGQECYTLAKRFIMRIVNIFTWKKIEKFK